MDLSRELGIGNSTESARAEDRSHRRRPPEIAYGCGAAIRAVDVVIVAHDVPTQSEVEGQVRSHAPAVLHEHVAGEHRFVQVVGSEGLVLAGGDIQRASAATDDHSLDSSRQRGIQAFRAALLRVGKASRAQRGSEGTQDGIVTGDAERRDRVAARTVPIVVLLVEHAAAENNLVLTALPGECVGRAQQRVIGRDGLPGIDAVGIHAGAVRPILREDLRQVDAFILGVEDAVLVHVPAVELVDQRGPNGPIDTQAGDLIVAVAGRQIGGVDSTRKYGGIGARVNRLGLGIRDVETDPLAQVVIEPHRGVIDGPSRGVLPVEG